MKRRSLLFAAGAGILALLGRSATTVVAENVPPSSDPSGMVWERHGDWHLNGSSETLRLGEAVAPGGLITAGTEGSEHSMIILLPDGQRLLCECFEAKTCAQGFRVPAIIRWPGKVPAGKVENAIVSGLDWFPTFVTAAGDPNIVDELKQGKQIGDRTYKVHLDGYDQTDLITGKGPSKRHEIFYLTESTLSAVRIDDFKYRFTDQPNGWLGATQKVDWPNLVNLRLDPYERTGMPDGKGGSLAYYNWFAYEFWRFVFVQQEVAKAAQSIVEFPPMQKGASFNMEAVKAQIQAAIAAQTGK